MLASAVGLLLVLCIKAVSSFSAAPSYSFLSSAFKIRAGASSGLSLTMEAKDGVYSTTTSEELIPREVLFGNPDYASPMLSPDGAHLAFLAPSEAEGVLNVFVIKLDDVGGSYEDNANLRTKARQVTSDKSRGIRRAFWGQDSKTILYLQDFEGNENFHLWALDAVGHLDDDVLPDATDLTPGEKVKASSVMTNKRCPNEILVGTNQRDEKVFDMYRCSYNSEDPSLRLEVVNPGDVIGWGADDETFEIREAVVRNSVDSSETIRVRDGKDDEWRDLINFPYGENGNLVDFLPGGELAYIKSSIGRETTALLEINLKSGEIVREIFATDKCDCGAVSLDQDTKEVRAVTYNYARLERKFFDTDLQADYDALYKLAPEGAEVVASSKSRDEKIWIVSFLRSDGPTEYVIYDQTKKSTKPLFVSKPDMLKYKFALMEDVRITARDGLEMVAYLTRAKTDEPTPLVLLVHGGPWARDSYGFRSQVQWFANRGYATLQVNYRGSSGYGKSFLHKGDAQWGVGDMQHDLTDAVKWAIDEGIADKDKICIYGGSYGGYACLAGLTFTPDLYCCGVDIVGPSNVKTLLDSIPAYWAPLRNAMLLKIGDVDSDAEFNRKISPLFHADNIKAPLLIGQGANDPRVKQAEADQIAFAMQDKGIPVEYLLYTDEGHGFARPENRIDFNGRAEDFLAKHLGGRAEPFSEIEGTSVTFPLASRVREAAK